jgi:hypothetical protein
MKHGIVDRSFRKAQRFFLLRLTTKRLRVVLIAQAFWLSIVSLNCGSGPKPINVAGNWAAVLTDSEGNPGTGALTLSQQGEELNGTFSLAASNCDMGDLAVTGTISGVQISLTKAAPDVYPVSLLLTLDATHQKMTGSYTTTSGVCGSAGTLVLTKQ